MARISNADVIKKAINELKLDNVAEKMPTQTSEKIQLVYPLDFYGHNLIVSDTSINNNDATLLTTPGTRDYYLNSAVLSMSKNVTSDNTNCFLRVIIGGVSSDILVIGGLTLTAQHSNIGLTFSRPIKIDRGTVIRLIRTATTVGSCTLTGSVSGYIVD